MSDIFTIYNGACVLVFAVSYAAGASMRAFQQIAEKSMSS